MEYAPSHPGGEANAQEYSDHLTIPTRKVSRRRFVSQTAAADVLAIAGAPMAGTAMAGMPKRGGTLRLGLGDGDSTMNLNRENAVAKAHYTIPMPSDMAPADDHNERMALKHAINREQMIENVLLGYGAIGNDHPIPSTDPFFNSELPQRPCDPDKAQFYLNKAGLSSLEVELSASDAAPNRSVDIATLFKESARPGNANLDVKVYPGDGFWSDICQKNRCWSTTGSDDRRPD